MAIKGGRVGSIAKLKSALKRGSGSGIQGIREGEIDVRFLAEIPDWQGYFEHYDPDRRFFPCDTDDCPGCLEGNKPSKRWLAPVLDVSDKGDQVIVIKLPVSVMETMRKYYERYSTITDRDFTLERTGSGLDTVYTAMGLAPSRRNTARYRDQLPDLLQLLQDQLEPFNEDDEDEAEEVSPPSPRRRSVAASSPRPRPRRRPVADLDDEDEDEDEDDSPPPRRRPVPSANGKPSGKVIHTQPGRGTKTPLPRPGQARRDAEQAAARQQPQRNGSAKLPRKPLARKPLPKPLPKPPARKRQRYDDDPPF